MGLHKDSVLVSKNQKNTRRIIEHYKLSISQYLHELNPCNAITIYRDPGSLRILE